MTPDFDRLDPARDNLGIRRGGLTHAETFEPLKPFVSHRRRSSGRPDARGDDPESQGRGRGLPHAQELVRRQRVWQAVLPDLPEPEPLRYPSVTTFSRYGYEPPLGRGRQLIPTLQQDPVPEAASFYLASAIVMCAIPYLDLLEDQVQAAVMLRLAAKAAHVPTTLG